MLCFVLAQALGLPTLALVAFLALRLRRTVRKLQYSALEIVFYYLALWVVSTLLLLRSAAQARACSAFPKCNA